MNKAKFEAAWKDLSNAEKESLNHNGQLFVRVNFSVPTGADSDWTFVGSMDNGENWRGQVNPFTTENLNAVGLDVVKEGEKITKLGQWFGIATVTDNNGTSSFSYPDAKTWNILYKWTDKNGNVQYTTFNLERAVVAGSSTPAPTE